MADAVRLIECAQCGRLHELAAGEAPGTCECGSTLTVPEEAVAEVSAPAPQMPVEEEPPAEPAAGSVGPGAFRRAVSHWKLISVAATVAIVATVAVAFVRQPDLLLAGFRMGGTGDTPVPVEPMDLEHHISILADNARTSEHLAASGILLQSGQTDLLIARLSELVMRSDLASRKLMIQMLGQLGDDRALEVLEKLFADIDPTVRQLAVSAVAQVDSPSAESLLRKGFAHADWARQMMPVIAAVRTRAAAGVLGACLRRAELRDATLQEIASRRVELCAGDVGAIAADRQETEEARIAAMDVLGVLGGREAHKALADLLDDSVVGWKARQVLERKGRP
jgi:hypothetical protein